jgi:uroporphyrinogen decarboxylase
VTEAVPELIDAGFDCLQPLEVKAGMDLVGLKRNYGDRLSFMGGIDVRTMRAEPNVIEEEIRAKIPEAKKGGGYIYHSDHSVPDDISFEQYRRVLELVAHYGSYS